MEGKEFGIKASEFEFKYRNSIEHFYPQNPNQDENHARLDEEYLNNFGNLCIMARRNNSLRSNLMPSAKIKEFSSTSQSLKFELMEKLAKNNDDWNGREIIQHGTEMKKLLSEFIS
ncbi:HNH endonuclease [Arthrobacter citreus]|nr:HNH endonuclease [Arthrobacter citreus]